MPDVLRVALDVPLRHLFDYLPPPAGAGSVALGARVRVPFGRQQLVGVVVEVAPRTDVPSAQLKPVLEVLDAQPVLDEHALALSQWAADYYHHPLGEVLAAALPKALRLGAPAVRTERSWTATPEGREASAGGEPARAPQQRRLLTLLLEPEGVPEDALAEILPNWREMARALVRRGWIASRVHPVQAQGVHPVQGRGASTALSSAPPEYPPLAHLRAPGPALTADQEAALARISASLGHFAAWVLHGITGSGKTEVYLRAIEQVLRRGERALVLVPEIGLTPQLVARFRERFEVPLSVMHSALTDGERLAAWRDSFSGRAAIVIGTRSAVFAPVPKLGLIVVDEEHDASFKQYDGGFRYSARDVAVVRAQRAGVPIVLGSATPALETLHNVTTQRYERLSLPYRATQNQPPRLSLIDLRAHPAHSGLSAPALQAIERHLREEGQVLVFLNRRGYAPTLLCTACGWIAPCKNCDARLTVHRAAHALRCHHCGAESPLPERCPQCGYAVKSVGQGTERVEETLAAAFSGTTLVRLDRDAVRNQADLESAMARVACGASCILVGTQMVTKGHDFPNMTLVVVLNADQGLFSTDFRAPERLAQTIVQVAGRAGRGTRPGEVLIQTEYPDHPLLANLLSDGYEGFAHTALGERSQAGWPPFSRLAAVRDSATTAAAALEFLTEARRVAGKPSRVRLLGPVPAAMPKRAGRYHAQLLIESPDRRALHRFLEAWVPEMAELPSARRVRWALDVDPIELF